MRTELSLGAVLALGACDTVYGLYGRGDDAGANGTDGDAVLGDLVLHFTMDTGANGLVDETGYGHVGLCQSECPTDTDGKVGKALHFDGSTVVGVTSDESLESMAQFTIAGWYRIPSSMPAPSSCPFSKVTSEGSNTWQLCFTDDRRARFYSTDGLVDHWLEGEPVSVDTYHHVVLWWDGTTKRIYVNGIVGPEAMVGMQFTNGIVGIGADYDHGVAVAHFTGDLDDLRIYRRALSSDEIIELVTSP